MPVTFLLGPKGERVEFADAPDVWGRSGLMPKAAVALVIKDLDSKPQTHVRPSDVTTGFTCRRQVTWKAANEYGEDPRERWAMIEGTAIHTALASDEIEVPGNDERGEVCGVMMRGFVDSIDGDTVEDYKTKSAFFITRYGAKGSGVKPWVAIWEPDEAKSVADHIHQLSIYGVLLRKYKDIHTTYGAVHRIYRGVKAKDGAFKTLKFKLLTEDQLETAVGPWMRELQAGLAAAQTNPDAWKSISADGRQMIGSKGNYFACDRCPLRRQCDQHDQRDIF